MTEHKDRPEVLQGTTIQAESGCGKFYLTINYDDKQRPTEVFLNTGKDGGCKALQYALGVVVAICLKAGLLREVIDGLSGIKCPSWERTKGRMLEKGQDVKNMGLSCPDLVARKLQITIDDKKDKK